MAIGATLRPVVILKWSGARVGPTPRSRTNIPLSGLPKGWFEIDFGEGGLWFTLFEFPLTFIDPATNTVTKQWKGPGGDAVRIGHGSVWLSNLRQQNMWRIDPKKL